MYLTEEFFMTLYKQQEVIKLFVLPICTHLQTYMYYLHICLYNSGLTPKRLHRDLCPRPLFRFLHWGRGYTSPHGLHDWVD